MADIKILQQEGHNFLWIDGELWMWDIPEEVAEQKTVASKAYGEVLVAGYGLGLVQKAMCEKDSKVDDILTIEKHEGVMDECLRVFERTYGFIKTGDFYNYRLPVGGANHSEGFDCVIGDIWIEQQKRFLPQYEKFVEHAKTLLKPDGKILAWGGDYFEYLIKTREDDDGREKEKG